MAPLAKVVFTIKVCSLEGKFEIDHSCALIFDLSYIFLPNKSNSCTCVITSAEEVRVIFLFFTLTIERV